MFKDEGTEIPLKVLILKGVFAHADALAPGTRPYLYFTYILNPEFQRQFILFLSS